MPVPVLFVETCLVAGLRLPWQQPQQPTFARVRRRCSLGCRRHFTHGFTVSLLMEANVGSRHYAIRIYVYTVKLVTSWLVRRTAKSMCFLLPLCGHVPVIQQASYELLTELTVELPASCSAVILSLLVD